MHTVLTVNTQRFKPLLPDDWGGPCSSCGKPQARWSFFPEDGPGGAVSVCGLCWLYESEWGKNRKEDLLKFKREVEGELGVRFMMSKGRLVRYQDADRLLGAIALTSQMFEMKGAGGS
jgi:hypothetical protein